MSTPRRVTIREYDTTEEAKAAEDLLLQGGLSKEIVARSGKKVRVLPTYETEARALLASATPVTSTYGGVGMSDASAGSTPGSYSQDAGTSTGSYSQDEGSSTTDAVSAVTDTVQQAAGAVTDTVQQAAGAVADRVQDAASTVTTQVDRASGAAASQVQRVADTVRQGATSPQAPAVQRQVAGTTANVLDTTAYYLRQGDLNVIVEDLRSLIRRHPLRSLAIGLGLGYLARGTFFAGAGGGQQGQWRSQQPPPLPRAVPISSGEAATGYDAAYNAGTMVPPMALGDLPTTADLATPYVDTAVGSDVGTMGDLSTPDIDTGTDRDLGTMPDLSTGDLDLGTDRGLGITPDLSTSYIGTGTGGDVGTLGDLSTGDLDTGTGGDLGTGAGLSTLDTAAGTEDDLADSLLYGTDAGTEMTDNIGTDAVDTMAGDYGDTASASGDLSGAGGEGLTDESRGSSGMPTSDQLRDWDANTRRGSS